MATLAIQRIDNDGLDPQYVAADVAGDKVVPGQGSYVHVKNGDATDTDVTLVTPGTVDGLAVSDRVVTVPAGGERKIAVPDLYTDPADGLAALTYEKVTSLTIGSFRGPVA
jgi:hypothetical protein